MHACVCVCVRVRASVWSIRGKYRSMLLFYRPGDRIDEWMGKPQGYVFAR
jgi:hypothetical protein